MQVMKVATRVAWLCVRSESSSQSVVEWFVGGCWRAVSGHCWQSCRGCFALCYVSNVEENRADSCRIEVHVEE